MLRTNGTDPDGSIFQLKVSILFALIREGSVSVGIGDGERRGCCGGGPDPDVGGADGVGEAHRDEMQGRKRRLS
ncbi:hypothetical protein RHMOL_Rhmol02G0015500 [Rhododendron molle]|uniref:Uncharacterized protein n=1 Tax=Rhododendron molle TaxID=49168 RepID=A0ACC0PKS4_RHOML|nr:hypothetical protein RHMOL_Rhmol02G0015500 [Rhododendron molle]